MSLLLNTPLQKILFLDIETVPEVESFDKLSDEKQQLFTDKTEYQRKEDLSVETFYQRAGIWAEFGKIVCISVGYFVAVNKARQFRVTSFIGEEFKILSDFKTLLDQHFNQKDQMLCAHNGKEFDFPYIARRMVINRISIPEKLNLFGKKPWEVPHLDTLELWKFGDYKHYTSLKLLANILDIPSPKDDIDGSEVAEVFYKEKNANRIKIYCEKDTITVAQLLLRFNNLPILNSEEIVLV
ncbi:MAG: 3'-5' exonuclease [Flavobacteriaceae bacterium CG1_02_35_72]|nr:MAG: 3'-5' exonuclease [Flavobacteriaceae bacterium CG1_02_35_72]PIR13551.1 MAG: 3'-5' exonuclease [Flavobacteriales bacterium CG11_big_fil_rev_8_21_14_0_20_35_7]